MSEPLKKPNQAPESYTPKELPVIVKLAAEQNNAAAGPIANTMPQPEIATRAFQFVGFEAAIDLSEAHWKGMDEVKAAMQTSLDTIADKVQPLRFVGMWQADPKAKHKKKKHHSKCLFFFGVEVSGLGGVPANCVMKDLPESAYAVFKGCGHGAPKYEWLAAAGYACNESAGFDMEQFGDIDLIDSDGMVDWYVPVTPESYKPKETPEIMKLAEEAQKNTRQKKERFTDRLSEITLVELPSAMVASYEVISGSPEQESGDFIEAWLEKRGLRCGENGMVRYGFDCHKGRDICGENTACTRPALLAGEQKGCWKCRIYHQYVTLPAGAAITGDEDVAIKEFPGGKFARITVRDPFTCDFPSAWYELLKWTFRHKIPNRLGCRSKKDCYSLFSNEDSPCLEEIYEENGVQYMAMYLPVE